MKNILIVEDSKTLNNIIKNELKSLNFDVKQAFTLKDVKELLAKNLFDLIILDLHLPDGEGSELIANIQSLTKTKVIVLTSTKNDNLREELFSYGILDYIIKDKNLLYSISEIIKIIQTIAIKDKDDILIIDDSDFICKQVTTILEPRNYIVSKSNNGEDGLKLLAKKHFDLLILDMELPDIHGMDILQTIRKQQCFINLPIIILSGTSTPEIIRNSLKNGASDFLKKPFVFEEFILKVDLWIDYYKQKEALKEKTQELEYTNKNLQKLVEQEVKKNREKEKLMLTKSRQIQMGEMISMIAHQWRQPLNAISTAVNFLNLRVEMKNFDTKTIQEISDKINKYVQHLSQTIDDFRDFFKPKKDVQKSDFVKIIDKTLTLLEYEIKKHNIDVNVITKNKTEFLIYENEILQVVLNIFKNAQDVLTEQNVKKPKINVIIDGTKLSIEDNGGGICEDIIDNIFDPYFSTKSKNGTGLGLYMSKLIVEEHCNGKLEVKNTQFGACFNIILPKNTL